MNESTAIIECPRHPDIDTFILLASKLGHFRLRSVDSTRLEWLEQAAALLAARCRVALAERACTARAEEEVDA